MKAGFKIPTESAKPRNNREVKPEPTTKPDNGRACGQMRPSSLQVWIKHNKATVMTISTSVDRKLKGPDGGENERE